MSLCLFRSDGQTTSATAIRKTAIAVLGSKRHSARDLHIRPKVGEPKVERCRKSGEYRSEPCHCPSGNLPKQIIVRRTVPKRSGVKPRAALQSSPSSPLDGEACRRSSQDARGAPLLWH